MKYRALCSLLQVDYEYFEKHSFWHGYRINNINLITHAFYTVQNHNFAHC